MSRLQVLYLPSHPDETRFALVIDESGDMTADDTAALREFAQQIGAAGCLVVDGPLEVQPGEDQETQVEDALGGLLAQALTQPPGQKPKLPPPHTEEGIRARIMGGNKAGDK